MAKGFVVNEPFHRNGEAFNKGRIISDREEVASFEGSPHTHHLIATTVPDSVEPEEGKRRGKES